MLRNLAIGAVVGFILAVVTVSVFEKQAAPPPPAAPSPSAGIGQPIALPPPTVVRPQLVVPQGIPDPTEHTRRAPAAGAIAPFGDEDAGR